MTDNHTPEHDPREQFRHFTTWQVLWPILWIVLALAVLLLVLTYVFDRFKVGNEWLPENALPVMLITGTVALIAAISGLVVVMARLGLTSWRAALGMPEGSVRAIIALLLIVLFFITAVFLYADVSRNNNDRVLKGISEKRFNAISTAQIKSAVRRVGGNPRRVSYDVTLLGSPKKCG